MPIPTVSSPFGANDSFAPDSEMPSFNFNNEFEFFDADESQNTTPNPDFVDLHAGNPLHFADPKALLGNPPGQIGSTKVSSYPLPLHRGSSSSSSSLESVGSSPKTSQTSGDVMMADGHMGPWKIEDSTAHNDSNFNMFLDSMDPTSLDMSHVFDFDSASSSPSPPSNNTQSTLASPDFSTSTAPRSPRTKRHKGHHKVQSVSQASSPTNNHHSY